MTIKCNICGYESESGRQMQGHMMFYHYAQYKDADCKLEDLTTGFERKTRHQVYVSRKKKAGGRPENLRLLNKNNQKELEAYNEGYFYIDPDEMEAYTVDEVKEKGWIK